MNSKNKKSSARALFVGHLGAVGLGSIMDIPDDTGMQWSMYVHRVRSEDTTHTHTPCWCCHWPHVPFCCVPRKQEEEEDEEPVRI